ncbi:hypothetical protein RCL10_08890 [Staphylococcus lloydii]|uniref:hypothetical protein n=1 Tax=Staphylococcus lloydii TaxID=2781774 RepID=UPI0029287019|nr:hypothetical protein [Staphylococcus lloydii]MDU9418622.1 hypothetical protein [Staphylococcus lloydii]
MREIKIKHSNKIDDYEKTELDLEIERELLENNDTTEKKEKNKNIKWISIGIIFILIMTFLRLILHMIM